MYTQNERTVQIWEHNFRKNLDSWFGFPSFIPETMTKLFFFPRMHCFDLLENIWLLFSLFFLVCFKTYRFFFSCLVFFITWFEWKVQDVKLWETRNLFFLPLFFKLFVKNGFSNFFPVLFEEMFSQMKQEGTYWTRLWVKKQMFPTVKENNKFSSLWMSCFLNFFFQIFILYEYCFVFFCFVFLLLLFCFFF